MSIKNLEVKMKIKGEVVGWSSPSSYASFEDVLGDKWQILVF
jgi:hypothetical protein